MSTPATSLAELVAQRKAAVSRGSAKKLDQGANRLRILPSWRGLVDPQFYVDFGQHFIRNAEKKVVAVYVCVERTFGRPCDVCTGIDHAIHVATNDGEIGRLKDAKAGSRVLVNALDLSGKPGVDPTKPEIYELPPSVLNGDKNGLGGLLSILEQTGYKMLNFADGYDVIITKAGAGKEGTSYTVQVALDSKPISPDVMKRINNLDSYIAQESGEQQRRALNALGVSVGARALPAPASTPPAANPMAISSMPSADLAAAQDAALRTIEGTSTVVPAAAVQPAPAAAAPAAPAAPAQPAVIPIVPPAAPVGDDPELEKLLSSI